MNFVSQEPQCQDLSLSDLLYSKTKQEQILKNTDSRDNIGPPPITCNSGQHLMGNSELFPV